MKISTKGRYALRILADIAEHGTEKNVPIREIAERQGFSDKYLEELYLACPLQDSLKVAVVNTVDIAWLKILLNIMYMKSYMLQRTLLLLCPV